MNKDTTQLSTSTVFTERGYIKLVRDNCVVNLNESHVQEVKDRVQVKTCQMTTLAL